MDLSKYERLTEKMQEDDADLQIWGGSGYVKFSVDVATRFNLKERDRVSVFANNDNLVFICGKKQDKRITSSYNNIMSFYLKGYPALNGKYNLIEALYEGEDVILKFKKRP